MRTSQGFASAFLLATTILFAGPAQAKRVCNTGTMNASVSHATDADITDVGGWAKFNPGDCYEDTYGYWLAIAQQDAQGRWGIAHYPVSGWSAPVFFPSNRQFCVDPSEPFHYNLAWGDACPSGLQRVPFGIYVTASDGSLMDALGAPLRIETNNQVSITPFGASEEARAFISSGTANFNKGKYEEAIADYTRAINASPRYDDAYDDRGLAKSWKDDDAAAIQDFTSAIGLNPSNPLTYKYRCNSLQIVKQYDKALADCTKAIQLDPNDDDSYSIRALVYLKSGKASEGLPDAEHAISLNPKNGAAWGARGRIFEALGRRDEALSDLHKALTLEPDLKPSREALARLESRSDQTAKAGEPATPPKAVTPTSAAQSPPGAAESGTQAAPSQSTAPSAALVRQTEPAKTAVNIGGTPAATQTKTSPPEPVTLGPEVADLLVVKHLPDSADENFFWNMMLARRDYERTSKDPQYGRFFTLALSTPPQPDSAKLRPLLPKFEKWTRDRAAALPDKVAVDELFHFANGTLPASRCLGVSFADAMRSVDAENARRSDVAACKRSGGTDCEKLGAPPVQTTREYDLNMQQCGAGAALGLTARRAPDRIRIKGTIPAPDLNAAWIRKLAPGDAVRRDVVLNVTAVDPLRAGSFRFDATVVDARFVDAGTKLPDPQ